MHSYPKNINVNESKLSRLSKDILQTLIYFDIFQYPLLKEEVVRNCSIPDIRKEEVYTELNSLVESGLIKVKGDFYFIENTSLIVRRLRGNQLAKKRLLTAKKISRFISLFPFVRCICLSGSISKGYMDKDSDIDYFIVTSPGRLWLCRTLLIFFKKVFLFNSRKYFCVNYFIDTEHLEIPDKNIFTAKELQYLIPVYNEKLYFKILEINKWSKMFLPNFNQSTEKILPENNNRFRVFLEKMFSGWVGEKMDNFCMKLTESFWKIKFRKIRQNEDIRIRCAKHVSKFHPRNFQVKVLEIYNQKVAAFENLHHIVLE